MTKLLSKQNKKFQHFSKKLKQSKNRTLNETMQKQAKKSSYAYRPYNLHTATRRFPTCLRLLACYTMPTTRCHHTPAPQPTSHATRMVNDLLDGRASSCGKQQQTKQASKLCSCRFGGVCGAQLLRVNVCTQQEWYAKEWWRGRGGCCWARARELVSRITGARDLLAT